jgi:hypothetical protein
MIGITILYWVTMGLFVFAMLSPRAMPAQTTDSTPRAMGDGSFQLHEFYWPFGILKVCVGFIGFGFYWAVHDLPGDSRWWMGVPMYIIAISGVGDLFFRRRHRFYPKQQHVCIEGFSLWRGRFSRTLDYAKIKYHAERRFLGKVETCVVWFIYPEVRVIIVRDVNADRANEKFQSLVSTIGFSLSEEEGSQRPTSRQPFSGRLR